MNAGPSFSAGAFKLYCSVRSEDGISSHKPVTEFQLLVEVAANNSFPYWAPTACLCAQLLSHVWLFVTPWTVASQAPLSMGLSSKNTGVGCQTLLQGIFMTQGSNPCLLCLLHWQVGSLPQVPSILLNSFHELAHVILTPTLQNSLLSPFIGWENWLQAPCYFQTIGGSWWFEDRGRSRVPQSDLVSMKTLLQYLHCWSLSIPLWIEKMVLIFQFMHQPSKEDVQAANKMRLFFCYISSGAVTVSIEETMLRWSWPSFASLLCCQSTFQTYSFYLLLAQTHPSSYQHSLDEAKGILKVQKGNGYQPVFLETLVSVFVFRITNFWEILYSLPPSLTLLIIPRNMCSLNILRRLTGKTNKQTKRERKQSSRNNFCFTTVPFLCLNWF